MLDTLDRWNRWGKAKLASGHRRDVVAGIEPWLDRKEVLGLIGPRRAGKSTVMFQLMDILEARGIARERMLHLNLEDPELATELGPELLDRVWATFRDEVAPEGRAYLFFDEVQVVPGWERWVRARNESEDVKIVVTGSSAKLLSRELGTLLTGRHMMFRVHPLGFAEFLRWRGVDPGQERRGSDPPALQRALAEFVRHGGFPEVVLAREDRIKEMLLKQYFDDVLYRDVAMRHEVRDLPSLRALAVHLLGQTAALVSHQRLATQLGVSQEQVRNYCGYLQEAMLVDFLSVYSSKLAVRARNPQKVFAIDTGLRNAVCYAATPDHGRLAETVAYGALLRDTDDSLCYWRNGHEVDLVVRRGGHVVRLVQVAYELDRAGEVEGRERAALVAAGEQFPEAERLFVVQKRVPAARKKDAEAPRSLARFLLQQSV
ncbi:MAG: ATP-binding protein [Planctomycetota bacterium]